MAKPKYLANPKHKEFHTIRFIKPECQTDEIKKPVQFVRGRDAIEAGYQACAKCSKYWKSRG
jgi:hypothetical protein